ncbi:MAG: 50S ribosomal protein L24 [Candidatus Marinimicrobia bacterium]|nr:50S ribosomal protein L24 [Candidatus Neomarinimicrobiota bacterium]
MNRIQKNDMVKVIAGNYKGYEGKVLKVYPDEERVIVEGVNFVKKTLRRTQQNPQGGLAEKEAPIHISNVKLLHNGEPTKVGYKKLKNGKKVRVAKQSGEIIDN